VARKSKLVALKKLYRKSIKDEEQERKERKKNVYKQLKKTRSIPRNVIRQCMWCGIENETLIHIKDFTFCLDCYDEAVEEIYGEKSQSKSSSSKKSGRSSKSSIKSGNSKSTSNVGSIKGSTSS